MLLNNLLAQLQTGTFAWSRIEQADDPDARFVERVEDEMIGAKVLKRNKFLRLLDDYLLKPCRYFNDRLGPEVFEPLLFDAEVYHELRGDKAEFYKALLN